MRGLTASSAARRMRAGELTPVELVESLLARIGETEPELKAYLTVCGDAATSIAKAAGEELRSGYDRGALHGIPVSVKDLIETKGIRTTAGSRLFSEYVPGEDATVVRRLKGAGAIVLGKTNTHEFAAGGVTPPTRNPWKAGRIPGGSSGGSAAAVAASSAMVALGSDTGGSIRIPASFCGIAGLKPTYGRVSRAGVFPESWSLDHVGPIAKTVEDCALVLNAISGADPRDPTASRRPVPDFTSAIGREIEGMRIGVPENYFFELLESGVRSAVRGAIRRLERLGAEVRYFEFPMVEEIMAAHAAIDSAECAAYHDRHLRGREEEYQPDVRAYVEAGYFVTAVQYIKALRIRGRVLPQVVRLFDDFRVMVTPTQPMVAPGDGASSVVLDGEEIDLSSAMVRLDAPFNLTGLPALSLPCGFSSEGLPVGLQLVGRPFDELSVLRVGDAYERATKWHLRRPAGWQRWR